MGYRIRKKTEVFASPRQETMTDSPLSRPASSGPGGDRTKISLAIAGSIILILLVGTGLASHIISDKKKKESDAATIEVSAEQLYTQGQHGSTADLEKSKTMFKEVYQKYSDTKSAAVAPLFIATIDNQEGKPKNAIDWLHKGLEKNAGNTRILPFYYESMGVTFTTTKEYDQALAMFQKVIKFPEKILADAAYFNIGMIYETLNQPALALINFQNLSKEFPNSPWAAEATPYLQRNGMPSSQMAPAPLPSTPKK